MITTVESLKPPKIVVLDPPKKSEPAITVEGNKIEPEILDEEISKKVHDTIQRNNEASKVESEKIRLLELENEQLKKERERLISEQNQPLAEAIKKTPENVEIEKAKEFYLNKNLEIEQLIKQVMTQ